MNADPSWAELWETFDDLIELAEQDRERRLRDLEAVRPDLHDEVRELLAHAESEDVFELDRGFVQEAYSEAVSQPPIPDLIDDFEVLSHLGKGGMGDVILAQRKSAEGIALRVALKILRPEIGGNVGEARFAREQEILSRLDHPNIARLFDTGVIKSGPFAGRSYYVLEYIDGVPIDEFCVEKDLGLRERVALLLQVCHAVSAAHRGLILHRDLKPSNILVHADGQPKLLDFGIAKSLGESEEDLTANDSRVFTPRWASPEQVAGETLSTASDVYSLGLLAHRLLSNASSVFDLEEDSIGKHLLALRDQEPKALSRSAAERGIPWAPKLRGDFDLVLAKALRKEPHERYETVDRFSDDLRAAASGLSVSVRAPTFWYQASRAFRRYPLAIALSVLLLLVILSATAAITWQAIQLKRALEDSATDQKIAEDVSDFLVGLFQSATPFVSRGEEVSVTTIVDQGTRRIQASNDVNPTTRAHLYQVLGDVHRSLGEVERAEELLQEVLLTPQAEGTEVHARALLTMAALRLEQGNFEDAQSLFQQAIAEADGLDLVELRARATSDQALLYHHRSEFERARDGYTAALADEGLSHRDRVHTQRRLGGARA